MIETLVQKEDSLNKYFNNNECAFTFEKSQ